MHGACIYYFSTPVRDNKGQSGEDEMMDMLMLMAMAIAETDALLWSGCRFVVVVVVARSFAVDPSSHTWLIPHLRPSFLFLPFHIRSPPLAQGKLSFFILHPPCSHQSQRAS